MANKAQVNLTFALALKGFTNTINKNMVFARACAQLAIKHFEEHGDVIYCQQFLDAMPKNYVRRVAFIKWLLAFSPILVEGTKLSKDKAETAVKFNTAEACKIDFWEFAPDMEQVSFDADDVVAAIQAAIKRFKNAEKYKPANDEATNQIALAEAAFATLPKKVA